MSAELCDRTFGPRTVPSCRPFDFTLYFEDLLFAVVPNGLFLLLCVLPVSTKLTAQSVVKQSRLLFFKVLLFVIVSVLQLVFLILRTRSPIIQTDASLAADVLGFVASLAALALSWLQHHRSEKPSSLLAIYLAALSLVMIARVRTLWSIEDNAAPAALLTTILLLTSGALTLESLNKSKSLRQPEKLTQWGPEPFIGFWALVAYAWVVRVCRVGYSKILSVDDLPALDHRIASRSMEMRLRKVWGKYDKSKRYSLVRASIRAFYMSLLAGILPRLCITAFSFAQPFMIERLVDFFTNRDTPDYIGKSLIGAYGLVFFGATASQSLFWYYTYRYIMQLRGALIGMVYSHTVEARAAGGSNIDGVTLMGADIERIVSSLIFVHEIWASTIDICIAVVLLERQLGVACLVPAIVVIVFVGITLKISPITKAAQRVWVEKVEERVVVTSTILSAMRAVKMLGLSDRVLEILTRVRNAEILSSTKYRKLVVARVFFSNSPIELAPLGTFALFVALSAKTGDSLLVGRAFASLSLIALITQPAWTLVQAIPDLAQCLSCFDRIQEFCNQCAANNQSMDNGEISAEGSLCVSESETGISLDYLVRSGGTSVSSVPLISFENQDFGWKKAGTPTLQGITAAIPANRFMVVLGATGSGKSTFLQSIIGETIALGGKTERNFGFAAYCSQVPWIINGTIKQNIIGGSRGPVDEKWYLTVVRACGLQGDLEKMPNGDETLVGDDGGTLSGGQRQRVSLARAVYSRNRLLLLDDVFSGIDAENVVLISERLFGDEGLLRQNNTTIILVTHATSAIALAQDVIVFDNGKILEQGTLEELRSAGGYVSNLLFGQSTDSEAEQINDAGEDRASKRTPSAAKQEFAAAEENAINLKRRSGDFSVYSYFSAACGHKLMAVYLLMNVLWMCGSQFSVVVVQAWSAASSQSNGSADNGKYLGAYAAVNLSVPLFSIVACWLLYVTIASRFADRLHSDILKAAVGASLQFFNTTDIGSIINRFTQDMELIALNIPNNILNYTGAVCLCISQGILLAINAKFLAISLPFVVGIMFFLQKFYLRTSRQVRLLDIEAKAPLYLHFLETQKGASTIRAFQWQQTFGQKLELLLDQSMRPVYLRYCLQQWLSFVLSMLVTVLAIILVTVVVIWRDAFDPASVGLSLLTVISFNKSLEELIRSWTILETSIGAVGRIKSFAQDTVPEETELDIVSPEAAPEHWPTKGAIDFTNVFAYYNEKNEPALRGLSVLIQPGQKTAVCGPSGSGKTSFILSILHMIRLEGTIQIDGVDISKLSLSDLRLRINVIPQEPLLLPGSVRFNIDPFEQVSDELIIATLRRLKLWDQVEREGGLDGRTSLASWSVGERQLLCMARAMVRKSQILILDEATSSVDTTTEALMQEVLETEFASQTIISVVHRLGYIRRYDKVLVIKNGELAEYDSPEALLSRPSILAEMTKTDLYTAVNEV